MQVVLTKVCSVCGLKKPLTEYQTRRVSRDGHTAACRGCLSRREALRLDNPKRVQARAMVRVTRRADPEKRLVDNQSKARWAMRNPQARRAHNVLNNALRDGKIEKPVFCDSCQKPKEVQAHHEDYSKPLEVDWLCTECHGFDHRKVA